MISFRTIAASALLMLAALPGLAHADILGGFPTCSTPTLLAIKSAGGKAYQQFGVGWVFTQSLVAQNSSKTFILTPAHVVSGSDSVSARCGNKVFALEPVGISETLDLAVLSVKGSSKGLNPISDYKPGMSFQMPPSQATDALESGTITAGAILTFPMGKEDQTPSMNMTGVLYVTGSAIVSPIYPHPTWLETFNGAIRPGMSGTPLLAFMNYSYIRSPLGMLTKVQNDSNEAAAIPMPEIYDALPALLSGQDAWKVKNPGKPYLDYVLATDSGGLERTRTLNLPQPDSTVAVISEVYATQTYSLSSVWTEANSHGHWADGGGSGNWMDVAQIFQTSPTEGAYYAENQPGMIGINACFYKDLSPCMDSGLKFPDGKVMIGMKGAPGSPYMEEGSIENFYPLAMAGVAAPVYEQIAMIQGRDDSNLAAICQQNIMGPNLALEQTSVQSVYLGKEIDAAFSFPTMQPYMPPKDAPTPVIQASANYSKSQDPNVGVSSPGLRCSADQKELSVNMELPLVGSDVSLVKFQGTIRPYDMDGTIQVGDLCQMQFKGVKKGYWSASIDLPIAKMTLDLNPSNPEVIVVDVLTVMPSCFSSLTVQSTLPWLAEFQGVAQSGSSL